VRGDRRLSAKLLSERDNKALELIVRLWILCEFKQRREFLFNNLQIEVAPLPRQDGFDVAPVALPRRKSLVNNQVLGGAGGQRNPVNRLPRLARA